MHKHRTLAVRNFLAAVIGTIALVCGNALAANQAPTVSITSPTAGAQFNAPASIGITANASDNDGSISLVEFYRDGVKIGQSTTSPYGMTWQNVAAGTYSLTAKAYDNLNKAATSVAVSVKVITVTTFIDSPASGATVSGRQVTVSGRFQGLDTTTVTITAGGGHSVVAGSGGGSFQGTVDLSSGLDTIEVQVARRDGTWEVVSREVTAVDPPVAVITGPASTGPYTAPASVTFTADAASAQGTITKVEYFDGGTSLGQSTEPPYTVNATLAAGSRGIVARATDSFGFTADSRARYFDVRSPPPVVQITSPADGATFQHPASISLASTASDPDGTISHVEYRYGGGTYIGSSSTPPYAVTWTSAPLGTHTIVATAYDNAWMTGTASIQVVVTDNVPPSVTLTSPTGSVTASAPATVEFSATASDSDGIASVEFLLNDQSIRTLTAAPYTFTKTDLMAGSYAVKARATDTRGGVTTTAVGANITVNPNVPPSVSIATPMSGTTFDAPATIEITATASDSDGTVSKVEFYAGSSLVGTDTAAPFSHTLTNVAPGNYVLLAVATDNGGATTTSSAVSVRVAMHTDPGETIVFLHNDVAGSPIAATDTAGELLWKESYRPFGEREKREAGSAANRQWFTGKAEDVETGLSYFGARYYDAMLGRFMATDPIRFDSNNSHTFNRFAYANNNPYRYVDPDGRSPADVGFALWDAGKLLGALAAWGMGSATGDVNLQAAGVEGIRELRLDAALSVAAIAMPVSPGSIKAGAKVADEAADILRTLKDGDSLPTGKALEVAIEHLGKGYKEWKPGIFKSADGTKVVRMTDADLAKAGNHKGAPHMNFETGRTFTKPNGKESFERTDNKHIFLPEER